MTAVIEIVNNLIKKAKENEAVSNVRFLKEFRQDMAERPVDGYIAVVKIENIDMSQSFAGGLYDKYIKGEMYSVKVTLTVYSGNDISGEELSAVTLKVYQALTDADTDNIIADSFVSPIDFDESIKAIYRKINFDLAFCLCGEN